jgi:hypothetical protein
VKTELLKLLRCPTAGQLLTMEVVVNNSQLKDVFRLVSDDGHHHYPIRNGIQRFVTQSNCADNFGMQWSHFRQTQLYSHSGLLISTDRFWLSPGFVPGRCERQMGNLGGQAARAALPRWL